MKRSRPLVVVLGLAVAGIVMLSWTQTWFTLRLDADAAVTPTVVADGAAAVPQFTALAIALLALFLAMTIAGRVVRVVLAGIEILLGLGIVVSGVSALSDPVSAARGAVGEVAGVSDLGAVRRIVTSVDVTAWPAVGIAGGVLAVLLGVVVLVVQRSWPGPSRKYAATPTATAPTSAPVQRDAIVDWDDLSAGLDPTDPADPVTVTEADPVPVTETDSLGTVGSDTRRTTDDAHDHEEHREHH
ncbi:Trp biosynthesis-associated membrane protein [Curtobacterium sp. VKM Ac-1395]|uniref:Trp biosynthesis-associated membrane protein n=1 Tax=Curtobacterium sp. VKM Ac-1395 TaxID=2783815 RepID=UPI00188C138B|nr:Trp biosynthesis-associated membrane protein [Curtobacterium sp. VKM Ac-1395]MBF4589686.1 Trp biosynthesis-associated membrane protein [Curtobacterium sp. VKM Ac-1395]